MKNERGGREYFESMKLPLQVITVLEAIIIVSPATTFVKAVFNCAVVATLIVAPNESKKTDEREKRRRRGMEGTMVGMAVEGRKRR